eukprot:7675409-Pyramimonas_sp.AAC.1
MYGYRSNSSERSRVRTTASTNEWSIPAARNLWTAREHRVNKAHTNTHGNAFKYRNYAKGGQCNLGQQCQSCSDVQK